MNNRFEDKAATIHKTAVSQLTVRRTRSATARIHDMVLELASNGKPVVMVLTLSEARQLRDWITQNMLKR